VAPSATTPEITVIATLLLVPVLALLPVRPSDEVVDAVDAVVHRLLGLQSADLSWGSLQDDAKVLDALARCPRGYTDLDGPFYRTPAQRLAKAKPGEVDDALVVLALGPCLSGPLAQARDAALQRLLTGAPRRDWETLVALRTYPSSGGTSWPAPQAGDPPEIAVLLAADPGSVAPPPVTDAAAWTRWARGARLRGLRPSNTPPVPEPGPEARVPELLAALQTFDVIVGVVGGGEDHGPPPTERKLPPFVAAGQDEQAALDRAWTFLESHQRGGTFGLGLPGADEPEPGITAMVLKAAIWTADKSGRERPAWIDSGLDFLVSLQQPDGAIQLHGLEVYTTSVALEALVAGKRPKDAEALDKARAYLMAAQKDEGEGYDASIDASYGGIGYGDGERPDLSNTQMALQAVALSGTSPSDPFFAKARGYLMRCQNLSEAGAQTWPRPGGGTMVMGNDGGSAYMPGNSEAGDIDLGKGRWQARSYGSMSYALAKSYVLCGVPPDDMHLQAVTRWLARNFSVETNPGFATPEECRQGLYYYRLVMARTLAMLPAGSFKDDAGNPIPWRDQLVRKILDSQREDGSWINAESPRWWEGAPPLATAYALLTLQSAAQ
jgi:squalene-hopene/tetraprenyl-beta-curcumene cyclase